MDCQDVRNESLSSWYLCHSCCKCFKGKLKFSEHKRKHLRLISKDHFPTETIRSPCEKTEFQIQKYPGEETEENWKTFGGTDVRILRSQVPSSSGAYYQAPSIKDKVLKPKQERGRTNKEEYSSGRAKSLGKNSPNNCHRKELVFSQLRVVLYRCDRHPLNRLDQSEINVKRSAAEEIDKTQERRLQTQDFGGFAGDSATTIMKSATVQRQTLNQCWQCKRILDSKYSLEQYMLGHARSKLLNCEVCGDNFNKRKELDNHGRIHGDKPFQCRECPSSFQKSYRLVLHMEMHTGRGSFKCSFCNKLFGSSSNFHRHVRIHTGVKPRSLDFHPFKCALCGKAFEEKSDLDLHCSSHVPGEEPFKCEKCGKAFGSKYHLDRHFRIHTGSKPFKCNLCVKAFGEKHDLDRHLRIHTGSKPFKCGICGKAFGLNHQLHRHFRIHTGKPFKCDLCGKTFSQQKSLDSHVRNHTGAPVKTYKCYLCGKAFGGKHGLERHFRIHTGSKPFNYNLCGKTFGRKHDLERHFRIHTGIKPFKCNLCGTSFTLKCSLDSHVRTHTGEKPFKCIVCSYVCSTRRGLKSHELIHTRATPLNGSKT